MKRPAKLPLTFMLLALLCAVSLAAYPTSASWSQGSGGYRAAVLNDCGASASTNTTYNMTCEVEAPTYLGLDRTTWNMSIQFKVRTANQANHVNTSKWSVYYYLDDGTTNTSKVLENKTFNYSGATHYLEFTSSLQTYNSSATYRINLCLNYTNASATGQVDTWTGSVDIQNTTLSGMLDYWVPILLEVSILMAVVGAVVTVAQKFTKN